MLDIKETLTIFCKYLKDTVDSNLTPEHFRLAKYNKNSEEVINEFWTVLDKYSYFVLKESNDRFYFDNFDKCTRTKLRLAYLQYPLLEIYSSSSISSSCSTRALLIALTWLITKYDILKNIVRLKLISSPLGRECSKVNCEQNQEADDARLSTVNNQIDNLLQKTNKLSNNLKAISELYMQKVKLMTRVHAASITTSALPHLSVFEMALIKRITTSKDNNPVVVAKIREMERTASMLDTHMKWTKNSHVFHTWMSSVLDEYEKTEQSIFNDEALSELARFIYLLRYLVKKKLKSLKNHDDQLTISSLEQNCPSKLLRVQKSVTEAHICVFETKRQFDTIDENLQRKRTKLENELRSILNSIPNCVQI